MNEILMTIPCHRIPDRCLHVKGKPMLICSRCLAMLLGYLAFPIAIILHIILPIWIPVAMAIPLLTDGFTQRWKWRKSNNFLRFTTGLSFGIGQSLFISTVVWKLVEVIG